MKNNHKSLTQVKPFLITTALLSSLFLGAEVARSIAPSQGGTPSLLTNTTGLDDFTNLDVLANVDSMDNENQSQQANEPIFIDSLTLVNESLQQVLALLEKWTEKILIQSNNLPKVTINLNIPMPLTRPEAVSVLKSALLANGVAVTPLDDKKLNVIPANRAKNSSPAIIQRSALARLPGSKEICCCLFRVNNLTAREAARIITPWVTPLSSSVVTLDKANSLFITDSLSNLQQLDRIFQHIDKVGDVQESILFFTPKNASAETMKKNFEDLQKGALKCYLLGNTSFAADEVTNLFVVITPKGNERLITEFFDRLDVNVDSLVQHKVFRIQHGSCKEMTELVKKLMQQQKQTASGAVTSQNTSDSFSKQLTIECDERLNAIVAYGTPSDLRQIQQLVDQLDVVLPQVRIEVIIAEVKLGKGQASGLESFGYNGNARTSQHSLNKLSMAALASGGNPFTVDKLTFPGFSIETIFNTAKTNSNVVILSSPTLLTTHAREAVLKITETRPYLKSIVSKAGSETTNSSVEKEDAGIELTVKPLIGLNGVIQLDIDQKVDNFTTESTSMGPGTAVKLPHINRRSIKSFISVQSGEMLILAGLKQREVTDQRKKIFFLGDLPILGDALFSSKVKQEEVRELIIFIRPFLLKDNETARENTNAYVDHLEEPIRKEIEAYQETAKFSDKSVFDDNSIIKRRSQRNAGRRNPHRPRRSVKTADYRPYVRSNVRNRATINRSRAFSRLSNSRSISTSMPESSFSGGSRSGAWSR